MSKNSKKMIIAMDKLSLWLEEITEIVTYLEDRYFSIETRLEKNNF